MLLCVAPVGDLFLCAVVAKMLILKHFDIYLGRCLFLAATLQFVKMIILQIPPFLQKGRAKVLTNGWIILKYY